MAKSPHCDSIFPQQAPAILSVTTKDGRRMVEKVLINRANLRDVRKRQLWTCKHYPLPRRAVHFDPYRSSALGQGPNQFMLQNETYTGVRHYNRMRHATEANREGNEVIRGKWIFRDRAEWI